MPFLEIGVGAKNIALGEAGVSTVNDATALYWNPAGITRIPTAEVTFQRTQWFGDTNLNFAAGAVSMGTSGSIGVHFYSFGSGEMEVRTLEHEEGTGERFQVQDLSLGLSYARSLTDNFAIGGTVKFLNSRLWRMSTSAMAMDVGILYNTPIKNLEMGLSISNFGNQVALSGDNTIVRVDLDPLTQGDNDGLLGNLAVQSWDLPLIFRMGLNYKLLQSEYGSFRIATDVLYPNNNNPSMNTGAEFSFRDAFFLRGGYSNLFLKDAYGQGHLRAGFGVQVASKFRADYAFSDRGDLGKTHLIGATVRF